MTAVSRKSIAQHYRRDGREKRAYETVEQFRAMKADLDTTRDGFDPDVHPYRCGFCRLIHGGHPGERSPSQAKAMFIEQEPLRSEIGIRALAHLGGENHGTEHWRHRTVVRRGRKVAA